MIGSSYLYTKLNNKKFKAVKKMKEPYILLSTHASFMDFPMIMKAAMPRNTCWVMSVEEFRRGDWLMYGIGGIPKRKFTHGIVTVKHVLYALRTLKSTVTIYPEARFELAVKPYYPFSAQRYQRNQRTLGRRDREILQACESARGDVHDER